MLARALKTLLLSLLALLLVLAAVFTYARMTSPSPAQREAMALLEARLAPPGDEGATWLRLASRDDLDDAAVAEAARTGAAVPGRVGEPPARALLPSGCGGPDCLAAAPALEAEVEAWSPAVARVRRGLAYDSVAARPRPEHEVGVGAAELRALWWRHALDFTRGARAEAIDATCADIVHLRRHAARPANLLERMLYGTVAEEGGGLLAAMLAAEPAAVPPASCAALAAEPAQAPGEAFCTAMAGEYAVVALANAQVSEEIEQRAAASEGPRAVGIRQGGWLLYDAEGMRGMAAGHMAAYCADPLASTMRADAPEQAVPVLAERMVDWVGQPSSIVLGRVAAQAYASYVERDLDLVARQRLLAARLLLQDADPAAPLAERLAALPDWVHSPTRRIEAGADGRSIQVALRGGDPGDIARMPLPVAAPADDAAAAAAAAAAPDAAP